MIKPLLGILVLSMAFLSGLLCVEYISLRRSIEQLAQAREEYRTYTNAFRKVLRDYQRLKEDDDEGSSCEDDEKKKEPFLVVNREPEYLKESMIRFLKEQNMEPILRRINSSDEWVSSERRTVVKQSRRYQKKQRQKQVRSLAMAQLARHRVLLKKKQIAHDISFIWPIDRSSSWISSFFGSRRKPDRTWGFHYGIDLAAIKGTTVNAVASGIIVEAGNNKGYGNTIVVMHNNNYRTRYAHLHKIYVRTGQHVEQGQRIGSVGDTGLVRKRGRYASHLHFEVYVNGKQVNPLYFFM